eukprot:TRINITY_DN8572_c0_g1_i1.p1 TRINITY_DN8572_c0_g1~~TRINITY_DN8572_c0_g1_i1.p1  ORF type:complete len:193 (-),score=56.34 TRINITY_DN8572_c0_g1_i1:259-837(-)
MEDPVGSPVKTNKEEMKKFLAGLPACTTTAKEILISLADESQCAAVLEFAIKDGPVFHAIDLFKVNEDGKIVEQKAYFHPSMGMGEKSETYKRTENTVQAYCAAASKKHEDGAEAQVALFADDFTMEDPVGSPVKSNKEDMKQFLTSLPACTTTAKEIVIAPDESQCAAVLEFTVKDGPTFHAIDTFKMQSA